jgi:hypothetical protein
MNNLPRARFRGFGIAVYHRVAGTKSLSRPSSNAFKYSKTGREPRTWIALATHTFIDTVGLITFEALSVRSLKDIAFTTLLMSWLLTDLHAAFVKGFPRE